MTRIAIIQGHPDAGQPHLCHALADAYGRGATSAGHEVRGIDVGELDFPLIRSRKEFEDGERPAAIRAAQGDIRWANHLLLVYPLWQGTMPALLKGFIEQVFRYDFAFEPQPTGRFVKLLKGRSARIAVTMGMPAPVYRWYFGAHSLKSLEKNILRFAGIKPIKESLFGLVDGASDARRAQWLQEMESLGRRGG